MVQLKGDRIGAYARYSSDKQNESSTDDQIRKIDGFLQRIGHRRSPKLTFTDSAVSAKSTEGRTDWNRLMEKVKRQEIDVLIVECTSRLSRNEADSFRAYEELVFHGVQLIGIDDGIDSTRPGARSHFGFKAIQNADYLEALADMTRRGLVGAAHRDLATGGKTYGYRTVAIPGPDPKRPLGYRVEIDPETKKIVLRIFREYADGLSLPAIAKGLNADGVPSSRAGSKHKRGGGWVASSIRVMLHNERYVGIWRFNERRWVKMPGSKKRVPRMNDPSDVIVKDYGDERRIVPEPLWRAAQERLKRVREFYTRDDDGNKKGRALNGQSTTYPLSGILVCDLCGAPMVIHGGSARRYYRCGDAMKRGTCSNHTSLRDDRAREKLLGALHERVASNEALIYLRAKWVKWTAEQGRTRSAEQTEIRNRIARTEQRLAKLVAFIMEGNASDSVATAIRDLEAQLKSDKRTAAELDVAAREPVKLPSLQEVLDRVNALEARLRDNPVVARESLRRLLEGGAIRMRPLPDGSYFGKAELYPLALIFDSPPAPEGDQGPAVNHRGSGGWISGRFTALRQELHFEVPGA